MELQEIICWLYGSIMRAHTFNRVFCCFMVLPTVRIRHPVSCVLRASVLLWTSDILWKFCAVVEGTHHLLSLVTRKNANGLRRTFAV